MAAITCSKLSFHQGLVSKNYSVLKETEFNCKKHQRKAAYIHRRMDKLRKQQLKDFIEFSGFLNKQTKGINLSKINVHITILCLRNTHDLS